MNRILPAGGLASWCRRAGELVLARPAGESRLRQTQTQCVGGMRNKSRRRDSRREVGRDGSDMMRRRRRRHNKARRADGDPAGSKPATDRTARRRYGAHGVSSRTSRTVVGGVAEGGHAASAGEVRGERSESRRKGQVRLRRVAAGTARRRAGGTGVRGSLLGVQREGHQTNKCRRRGEGDVGDEPHGPLDLPVSGEGAAPSFSAGADVRDDDEHEHHPPKERRRRRSQYRAESSQTERADDVDDGAGPLLHEQEEFEQANRCD